MSGRFVILHHRVGGGEHWDLMLERGDALMTWQLLAEPMGVESLPIAARRIGNHRKAYLTYEGPVSRNRGEVRRVDAGTLDFEEVSEGRVVVRLSGRRLSGRFVLRDAVQGWVMEEER